MRARKEIRPAKEADAGLRLDRVGLDGSLLPAEKWAWDGATLWLDAKFRKRVRGREATR